MGNIKELYDDIIELTGLRNHVLKLEKEIKSRLEKHSEGIRIHKSGDVVDVFSSLKGTKIGVGIVGECKTSVWVDDFLHEYVMKDDKMEKLERDLNYILYEVFSVKKDMTRSSKHFFQSPHFLPDISSNDMRSDYYIKKRNDE